MQKVISVTPLYIHSVLMEDGTEYIRFAEDEWWQVYGNSLEAEYYEEEKLEKLYQEYTNSIGYRIRQKMANDSTVIH